MSDIICPHCGQSFSLDNADYLSIVQQVRTKEFDKDVDAHLYLLQEQHQAALLEQQQSFNQQLAVLQHEVDYYKNFKLQMSTKMVGETLEKHCENEFNKIRMTAFPLAYFEKDNDASNGSKGDYIFREHDVDSGCEIISIMFEMKNEMDSTERKHKNEDFFKKLDADRREKNCEYAVLVSMLEADNDFYNQGIVDVSWKYPKMYVIRPQFFIPFLTLLYNNAKKSFEYKRQLAAIQAQDIQQEQTDLERAVQDFYTMFSKHTTSADCKMDDVIKQLDMTIKKLQKVRESCISIQDIMSSVSCKADRLAELAEKGSHESCEN